MKDLIIYIKEQLMLEGGHAVKSNPIPASISPKVYKQIEDTIHKSYPDIKMSVLGSVGKKNDDQTNGDIDIAIKVDSKKELQSIIDKCFPGCEVNNQTTATIVSIGYPYNIDSKSGVAQVDFMFVKNLEQAIFNYHSPNYKNNESKYKGAVRTYMLSDLVSSIPVKDAKDEYFEDGKTLKRHWKMTYNSYGIFKQLIDYCGKNGKPVKNGKKLKEFETLITENPKEIVAFLFGKNGSFKDTNSAESIWAAVHDKSKFQFDKNVVEKFEEKFYNDTNNIKQNVNLNDFPCEYYHSQKK